MPETVPIPDFIARWLETLPDVALAEIAPEPAATGIFSTDMVNGFLREGPLASPRVNALTEPVVTLVEAAWRHGVRDVVFTQDTHDAHTPEFRAWPPHCIAGTSESRMISDLETLSFADAFTVIPKNSLSPAIDTRLEPWLDARPNLRTAIVVGNCTDLCVYQLAMYLRLRADALNLDPFDVIVPANAVDTFDIPHHDGSNPGDPHPADFFHHVFLYHMATCGIRVVGSLTAETAP